MTDHQESRRAELRKFLTEEGGFARVTEKFGLTQSQASYLSQLTAQESSAPFGERSAKNWEERLRMKSGRLVDAGRVSAAATPIASPERHVATPPDGYIRLEHLSPQPSMGGGAYLDEPTHVVRHLDVLEQWVRQKVGTTDPERIKVLTGHGQSMLPTIQDQDLVFVDIAQRSIEVAGIYVIDVAGRLLLKKALILTDGTLILRSDNTADYPDEERHDLARAADTICVAGRVLAWWTLRRG